MRKAVLAVPVLAFAAVPGAAPTSAAGATQTGTLSGGPLATVDAGDLYCGVQSGATHDAGGVWGLVAGSGSGTVTAGPGVVAFAPGAAAVYVCAEFSQNGMTWYWDAGAATWTGIDSRVACGQATPIGGGFRYSLVQ